MKKWLFVGFCVIVNFALPIAILVYVGMHTFAIFNYDELMILEAILVISLVVSPRSPGSIGTYGNSAIGISRGANGIIWVRAVKFNRAIP